MNQNAVPMNQIKPNRSTFMTRRWITGGLFILTILIVPKQIFASPTAQKPKPKPRVSPTLQAPTTAAPSAPVRPSSTRLRSRQDPAPSPPRVEITIGTPVVPAEFTGDVRSLPQTITPQERALFEQKAELDEMLQIAPKRPLPGASTEAPVDQTVPQGPMPGPLTHFPGLNFFNNGAGWPPDTVGDVGPNHYVQAVNTSVGIFNKTGTQLAAFTFNTLWSGASTGTPCDAFNRGDPTVVYVPAFDRWIVADFAWSSTQNGPYYECIAVSKTSDPVAGGWWLYPYRADDAAHPWLPDYPKMGIWPDGLYMTANMFDCITATCSPASYMGPRVYALNINDLVSGAALRHRVVDLNSTSFFSLLPSNYRGTPPPPGRENLLVSESLSLFAWEMWQFHVDYNGAGSTFTGPTNVSQSSYILANSTVPSPGNSLDSIRDRAMMQAQYRNISGVESLWVNHTVGTPSTATPTSIQWAQINVTGGDINTTPVQEQIYNNASDGLHRWMGSLAVDRQGNMTLGYSVSSLTLDPDIRYVGRLSSDPLNTLPQTEVTMLPGITRSIQTGICGSSTCRRWGDYSAMSVDPTDDCTFWYTTEYYEVPGLNWQTRIGSFKFPSCGQPTQARLKYFSADRFDDGRVLLKWTSNHEVDNLGFNVYRELNGRREKLNPQIVAGSALMTGPKVALSAGQSYAWGDQLGSIQDSRYWLEAVDLAGRSTWNGPITASSSRGRAPSVSQSELLSKVGLAGQQLTLGQASTGAEADQPIASTPGALVTQSGLAAGTALKLSVKQEGWYRVSMQDLIAAGLDPGADTRNLQLFIEGREIPIIVAKDGKQDSGGAVEFYGTALNTPATDTRVYWLVAGSKPGLRIGSAGAQGGTPVTSFPFAVERKDRTLYFASLRNGEAENFFGPVIGSTGAEQSLRLTNIARSQQAKATLEVAAQGVSQVTHSIKVYLNDAEVGKLSFNGQSRGLANIQVAQSLLREGDNVVKLIAVGGPADVSLTDAVRITYARSFAAESNQLRFTASGGQQVTLTGFTGAVRVLDVTDPAAVTELTGHSKAKTGVIVSIPGAGQRKLLALTPDQSRSPVDLRQNMPSNWRESSGADYVAISRRDIMASLDRLVAHRRNQGLTAAVVDVEDVYDEFSFGNKSPQALKDFLAYAKSHWKETPRYVLLAGDGSYDPKGYLGATDGNVLPAGLIDTQYLETASDDWFVDFDNDGLPEMSIGRLPVRNATEAARMADKIVSYENSTSSTSILLVSDIPDSYDFVEASDRLRAYFPADATVSEVRRGSADDATVKKQLLSALSNGNRVVNYGGHGSLNQWRGGILTVDDVRSLSNGQSLSLFVAMNCLNGYFVDPVLESLGEALLRSERGGASAVWASAGQTEPVGQALMNEAFYRQVFGGEGLTIGEAANKAKASISNPDIRRTWVLLGDPAMKLE